MLPKLAWSAPRDAAWIAKNGSLKCSSPGDIFLLLKTSECVAYDLTQAYRHCAPPVPAPGPPQVCTTKGGSAMASLFFLFFVFFPFYIIRKNKSGRDENRQVRIEARKLRAFNLNKENT